MPAAHYERLVDLFDAETQNTLRRHSAPILKGSLADDRKKCNLDTNLGPMGLGDLAVGVRAWLSAIASVRASCSNQGI